MLGGHAHIMSSAHRRTDGFTTRHDIRCLTFFEVIPSTLRAEFGSSTSSVKTVARLTRTNERAVRNWSDGKNGPSGENLVSLMS